jgi:hypothetical protein
LKTAAAPGVASGKRGAAALAADDANKPAAQASISEAKGGFKGEAFRRRWVRLRRARYGDDARDDVRFRLMLASMRYR